jgi:Flp pilus assembly pilin Flp
MSKRVITTHSERAREERGQTMAEYSVVLGVITLAVITAFAALSGGIEAALGATIALIDSAF